MKTFLFLLLITNMVNAQDSSWKKIGDYSLSGNYIHVNSVKQKILNSCIIQEFNKKYEYHQFFINYTYLKKDSLLISNDFSYKYQHKKSIDKWNVYNYIIYSFIKSRSILNRGEIGLGIGREFINTDKLVFNLSVALDYSNTQYVSKTINCVRISNRLHSIINFNNFNLNAEIYIQPDIRNFDNINYNWILKLNIPMYKNFICFLSSVRSYETYNFTIHNTSINDNLLIGIAYKY